ncbi:MAG: phosphonate C-P lyase system protein PhnK [Desulfobacterota bacterium]|nr:phosphonate C-P lyase system protein PhnK [Thermodesulfobacteriota bacterium]
MRGRVVPKEPDPILRVVNLSKLYGPRLGCWRISFDLWPGEVLGIVGESGSGKTTLLHAISHQVEPSGGQILYRMEGEGWVDLGQIPESKKRHLMRTEWGMVRQNPREGLRMKVSAGANIGERLMALGERHYGRIREEVLRWLDRVEIDPTRATDLPETFSGGMLQRLQLARTLVTSPRLVLMDEPTGGLDVSVQARLLDLLRRLVAELNLSLVLVTHDLSVARLLAHRLLVMKDGEVVEAGLTDQVLDDPHHPYTQLLVSSVLQA